MDSRAALISNSKWVREVRRARSGTGPGGSIFVGAKPYDWSKDMMSGARDNEARPCFRYVSSG